MKNFKKANRRIDQIYSAVSRYDCRILKHSTAQTGTNYLTISTPNGQTIKVRIANHMDAYGTADYHINPNKDDYVKIKTFIIKNGTKPAPKKRVSYAYIVDGIVGAVYGSKEDALAAANDGVLHKINHSRCVGWVKC